VVPLKSGECRAAPGTRPGRGRDAAGTRPGRGRDAAGRLPSACRTRPDDGLRAVGDDIVEGPRAAPATLMRLCSSAIRRRRTALGASHARSRRRHTAWALHQSPTRCSKRCSDTVTARAPAALKSPSSDLRDRRLPRMSVGHRAGRSETDIAKWAMVPAAASVYRSSAFTLMLSSLSHDSW
jgi:hypothetical protein